MATLSLKKSVLGTALLATALASASPALANDYRYRRHDNGDAVGAAVVGGIIGLTIGALIASSGKHGRQRCDDRRYDDRRHDNRRCYRRDDRPYNDGYNDGGYYNGYPQQDGYYGNDGRYYRNDGGYADGRGYRGY